jgi:hypothetical protein
MVGACRCGLCDAGAGAVRWLKRANRAPPVPGRSNVSSLLGYVNNSLNSGAKTIVVPAEILEEASDEEKEEARRLCALSGIKLVVR